MKITLLGYSKKADHINGHLSSSIGRLCDTVENAAAAIPVGKYRISIIRFKQYSRKKPIIIVNGHSDCAICPLIELVSNNTPMPCFCPQITPGNGMHNRRDGAIIVGKRISSGVLIRPRQAFNKVYELLRKSAARGHRLTLVVRESYPATIHKPATNYELGQYIISQMDKKHQIVQQ